MRKGAVITVVVAHWSGKDCQAISKQVEVHCSTLRNITDKTAAALPRSRCLSSMLIATVKKPLQIYISD